MSGQKRQGIAETRADAAQSREMPYPRLAEILVRIIRRHAAELAAMGDVQGEEVARG